MYRSCWNALIALLNDTTDKKENEALAIALKISPWWCGTRNFENNSTYSVPRSGYHKPVAKRKEKEGKKKDNAIKIVHSFFFRLFFFSFASVPHGRKKERGGREIRVGFLLLKTTTSKANNNSR